MDDQVQPDSPEAFAEHLLRAALAAPGTASDAAGAAMLTLLCGLADAHIVTEVGRVLATEPGRDGALELRVYTFGDAEEERLVRGLAPDVALRTLHEYAEGGADLVELVAADDTGLRRRVAEARRGTPPRYLFPVPGAFEGHPDAVRHAVEAWSSFVRTLRPGRQEPIVATWSGRAVAPEGPARTSAPGATALGASPAATSPAAGGGSLAPAIGDSAGAGPAGQDGHAPARRSRWRRQRLPETTVTAAVPSDPSPEMIDLLRRTVRQALQDATVEVHLGAVQDVMASMAGDLLAGVHPHGGGLDPEALERLLDALDQRRVPDEALASQVLAALEHQQPRALPQVAGPSAAEIADGLAGRLPDASAIADEVVTRLRASGLTGGWPAPYASTTPGRAGAPDAAVAAAADRLALQAEAFDDRVRAASRALERLAEDVAADARGSEDYLARLTQSFTAAVERMGRRIEHRLDQAPHSPPPTSAPPYASPPVRPAAPVPPPGTVPSPTSAPPAATVPQQAPYPPAPAAPPATSPPAPAAPPANSPPDVDLREGAMDAWAGPRRPHEGANGHGPAGVAGYQDEVPAPGRATSPLGQPAPPADAGGGPGEPLPPAPRHWQHSRDN